MKIALLLTGKVGKFFKSNISSGWRILSEKYNLDVFIVTDDDNYYDPIMDAQIFSISNTDRHVTNNDNWRRYYKYDLYEYEKSKELLNNLFNNNFKVNLKNIRIMDYSKLSDEFLITLDTHRFFMKYESGRQHKSKTGIINQFYKLYECYNDMCMYESENNFKYDMVIRCRIDCFVHLIENLDLNKKIYCGYSNQNKHIYDWWAIGDRFIMGEYCNYYNILGDYLIDGGRSFIPYNGILHDISDASEVGLTHIINKNNYNIIDQIAYNVDKTY